MQKLLGSAPSQCPQPQRRRPAEVRPRLALQRRLRHGRPRSLALLPPRASAAAPAAADPAPPNPSDAATAEPILTAGAPYHRCRRRRVAGFPPRFFLRPEGLDGRALSPRPPWGVRNATAVTSGDSRRRGSRRGGGGGSTAAAAAADVLVVVVRRGLLSLASEEPHLRKKGVLNMHRGKVNREAPRVRGGGGGRGRGLPVDVRKSVKERRGGLVSREGYSHRQSVLLL